MILSLALLTIILISVPFIVGSAVRKETCNNSTPKLKTICHIEDAYVIRKDIKCLAESILSLNECIEVLEKKVEKLDGLPIGKMSKDTH